MNITKGNESLLSHLITFSFFLVIWFLFTFVWGFKFRPTSAVEWWTEIDIVGGRDEVAGGTWLACSRGGRVVFLTNVMELHERPDAKSRGELPLLFLQSSKGPREFAEGVAKEADQYNGFNLIVADILSNTMVYISNRAKCEEAFIVQDVSPGIHVLSNAHLDSPWPKEQKLRQGFKEQLVKLGDGKINLKEIAKKLMRDRSKAEKNRLPGICSADWEYALSSIFVEVDTPLVKNETLGPVASSVKLIKLMWLGYSSGTVWHKEHYCFGCGKKWGSSLS